MDVFFTVTRINLANKALPSLAAFFQVWLLWMTLKATKLATKMHPMCHLVHIITTLLSTKVVSLIQC